MRGSEKKSHNMFNIIICVFNVSYFYLCQFVFSVHFHTQLGCHRLLPDLPGYENNVSLDIYKWLGHQYFR